LAFYESIPAHTHTCVFLYVCMCVSIYLCLCSS